ncbi:esterase-like activity of phytase family protein [Mesorhizobium qingshengii]|uniref:Esterase-like activity of phytase family protein n=1 Tax=Mesorhizobium qingshengii TaxID=1165689 RepID=A0ABT4QX43_9HYPH|nr:esterase-like activity of phytase family protein [Mesorhizobium qingshengii]MCZ8546079.1 esterase-like activity of phytase family protein [Mesorhizobium qingshengii]
MKHLYRTASLGVALALFTALTPALADSTATVGGTSFANKGLVGVGRIPAGQRDKFGETFGSGSGMAIDTSGWTHDAAGYKGSLWLLPDRGYNVAGTTDYRPRLNTIGIEFSPVAPGTAPAAGQEQTGVKATLADSLLLTDDKGADTTGLDPLSDVRAASGDMPMLPAATNGKLALDNEAIVRLPDGSMFISDEYGPNIYRFSAEGRLMSATQPPAALVPMRKGAPNFSSDNPGPGAADPDPKDPDTGRQNNQGLEGMAMTPDGKFLIAVLQSAARQDGGDSPATRQNTRALVYDASDLAHLKLAHEYVVPLPVFKDAKGKTKVAAQSEIVALSDQTFLMLMRDSGNGQGLKGDTSLYREINIVDLSGATDIAGGPFDAADKPVAPKGVVDPSVTPAKLTPFIDINDNAELGRFGLHNGAPNDHNNLSEKWEAMSLASVLDPKLPDDYFLFVANDNDFLNQDGFQVGAGYKADDGANVDTMFLVYQVTLPGLARK